MKLNKILVGIAITSTLTLSGCASNGDGESSFGTTVKNAGSSVGKVVSNMFNYESGVKITEAEMKQVKTEDEVIKKFGHPDDRSTYKGNTVYKYPYVYMPSFGTNINENTVFEINSKGKVVAAYKTNRKGTGIEVVDQAMN